MSAGESAPTLLAWIDLETTGLDLDRDRVIEVACVLTGPSRPWANIARRSWLVADARPEQGMAPGARELHDRSGLAAALGGSLDPACQTRWPAGVSTIDAVDGALAQFIVEYRPAVGRAVGSSLDDLDPATLRVGAGEVWLAGSGVAAFDRHFIDRWMPATAAVLSYRTLDVSQVRRAARLLGYEPGDRGPIVHRALPDVLRSLHEWADLVAWIESRHAGGGAGAAGPGPLPLVEALADLDVNEG